MWPSVVLNFQHALDVFLNVLEVYIKEYEVVLRREIHMSKVSLQFPSPVEDCCNADGNAYASRYSTKTFAVSRGRRGSMETQPLFLSLWNQVSSDWVRVFVGSFYYLRNGNSGENSALTSIPCSSGYPHGFHTTLPRRKYLHSLSCDAIEASYRFFNNNKHTRVTTQSSDTTHTHIVPCIS